MAGNGIPGTRGTLSANLQDSVRFGPVRASSAGQSSRPAGIERVRLGSTALARHNGRCP